MLVGTPITSDAGPSFFRRGDVLDERSPRGATLV
jgi:hypothetical protein